MDLHVTVALNHKYSTRPGLDTCPDLKHAKDWQNRWQFSTSVAGFCDEKRVWATHMASYLLSALNTFMVPAVWVVECPFMSGQKNVTHQTDTHQRERITKLRGRGRETKQNECDQDESLPISSQHHRQDMEILCCILYNCITHWLPVIYLYIPEN